MEKQSFSLKLLSRDFYGQSFIKTVRGPFIDLIYRVINSMKDCLFVRFLALRHKSTAMVNHGRTVSSPSHTFSWAGLNKHEQAVNK